MKYLLILLVVAMAGCVPFSVSVDPLGLGSVTANFPEGLVPTKAVSTPTPVLPSPAASPSPTK